MSKQAGVNLLLLIIRTSTGEFSYSTDYDRLAAAAGWRKVHFATVEIYLQTASFTSRHDDERSARSAIPATRRSPHPARRPPARCCHQQHCHHATDMQAPSGCRLCPSVWVHFGTDCAGCCCRQLPWTAGSLVLHEGRRGEQ